MTTDLDARKAVQPEKRQIRMEEVGGDLELSSRQRPWGMAIFLLLWLTGWTAACICLVHQFLLDRNWFFLLFAIPFLASWVFVFTLVLWMLFGVEYVRLGADGLEYRATALATLFRRTIPLADLKGVCAGQTTYQASDENEGRSGLCLKFETMGQPLLFAHGISEPEQLWLVQWLNEYLDALGKRPLAPMAIAIEPPSDSRIDVCHRANGVDFVWPGDWSLPALAATTFLNLFWNGILSLFICKQVQDFEWSTFFIMIPHEIIGLLLLALWLAALTAPAWRLTWTFGEREVTRHLSISDADAIVFAFGWTKRLDVQPPLRIAVRRNEEKKQQRSLWWFLSHPDGEYTLYCLGEEDRELLAINNLTEGDARWMAGVLLHAFPSWSLKE